MTQGTVFIVDDDPQMRESVALMLSSAGFDPRISASAEEFLLKFVPELRTSEGTPRCIVLDVRMPGMGGLGLHRKLIEEDVPIPTVILTGYADVPMAVRALQDGAIHFLEKPIHRDTLQRCIEEALAIDAATQAERERAADLQKRLATLSPREHEVLGHLRAAKNLKQIAAELGIGLQTIAKHRARLLRKLGVRNDVELAQLVGAANH